MGEFLASIDWSVVWSFGWPVLVAVPGFIAFRWQWIDRSDAKKARAPFIAIRLAHGKGIKSQEGWEPVEFLVRNDADVPIIVSKLEVVRPRGVTIAMLHRSPSDNSPDPERMGSTLTVKWRIEPKLANGRGGEQWSAQTLGFLGSTKRSISDVQVSIRATFSEMSAARRTSTTIAVSDPMELTQVTTDSSK